MMIKLKTFNEHYDIYSNNTEHLNILMENDLEAFIDPYHIANNLNSIIAKKMYVRSKSFLETLNRDFVIPNQRKKGLKFLSHLREANEFHLGYSLENRGKGIGYTKAEVIYDALRSNDLVKAGITLTNEAHNVLLLVKGIGQDNMSDTLANVCRDILADFTLKQCIKYNIPVKSTNIEYFDHSLKRWENKNVKLPEYNGKSIVLVPQFLTSGKRIYTNHYNWYISSNYISKEILDGTIPSIEKDNYINKLKDGTKKAIIKNINRKFRKPKNELIDFVKNYSGSLINFQDYVKTHYPSIDIDKLLKLYNKAS